jgi:hypothetical protein
MRRLEMVLCALAVLILLVLANAVVVARRIPPVAGWIHQTPIENLGRFVAGQVARQDLWCRRWLNRLPLLAAQARARQELERQIEVARPTHMLVLRDRRVLWGRCEPRTAHTAPVKVNVLEEGHREFPVEQVARLVELMPTPVRLTAADARFLINFPGFNYYDIPPYFVASEAPFSMAYWACRGLARVSEEFSAAFAEAVPRPEGQRRLYVCIFRDEVSYLRYALQRMDVDLERSSGFYSPENQCLYLYNRLNSLDYGRIEKRIRNYARQEEQTATLNEQVRIRETADGYRKRIRQDMWEETAYTLRHEGTHQLAYTSGLHSAEGVEHLWVVEGVAQYCETSPLGERHAGNIALLRQGKLQGKLIPWFELINTPTPRGFSHYGRRADLAYAQSWFLVYTFMQAPYKAGFMAYLRRLQHLPAEDLGPPRSELLEEELGQPIANVVMKSWADVVFERDSLIPGLKTADLAAETPIVSVSQAHQNHSPNRTLPQSSGRTFK